MVEANAVPILRSSRTRSPCSVSETPKTGAGMGISLSVHLMLANAAEADVRVSVDFSNL